MKLVCRQYNTFHENYIRVNEILREMYWEAKRAPTLNTTAIRNPYRKEQLKKKFLGKTKEERVAKLAELQKKIEEHKIQIDAEEMGLVEAEKVKLENTRKKRRDIAAKRL